MKYIYLALLVITVLACSKEEGEEISSIHYFTTQEELESIPDNVLTGTYDGSISIGPGINNLSKLNQLEQISGYLTITSTSLTTIELSKLKQVGRFDVRGNEHLTSINLPKLTTIDSTFIVSANTKLEYIKMNNLASIGMGSYNCLNNNSLVNVELHNLEFYEALNIRLNPKLSQLKLGEELPESCHTVLLEFEYINENSVLFPNSNFYCSMDIEIHNTANSSFEWLLDLSGINILRNTTLIGEYEINQFCFLKQKLSEMAQPDNFRVRKSAFENGFTGKDIVHFCN